MDCIDIPASLFYSWFVEAPKLDDLEGFERDAGNRKKIEERMDLETVQSAFLGEPIVFHDERHSEIEPRWFLMNRVGKRNVSLVFTVRNNKIRVFSARYMHEKEVRKYGKKIG